MAKKLLIDCDPGIDDALALAFAHGRPELDVVAVTTVGGNVPLEHTTANALDLAEYYGMDVPVSQGAGRPLVRPPHTAPEIHGVRGLGNIALPGAGTGLTGRHAVDTIIDTVAAAPGEISLVAIGPLTNIALALHKEPRLTAWVREFVLMGGSYGGASPSTGSTSSGNTTTMAEFNIYADPEAAAVVFGAGWTPVMVGLDLTRQARATGSVRERFTDLGRLEREVLSPGLDFYGRSVQYRTQEGPPVHDACAVAYALDPSLVDAVPARVDVETRGEFTTGMTITNFDAQPETRNALVATELHAEPFWDRMTESYRTIATNLL